MTEHLEKLIKFLKHFLPIENALRIYFDNCEKTKKQKINILISEENNFFSKSRYFLKKGLKNPIHFTSLESAEGIINSNNLRLYNLYNMNDPIEFDFSSRIFNNYLSDLPTIKENLYSMSFSSGEILDKERFNDQFNQWRLYGDNGYGVCIEFDIINNPINWINFHMSKIQYAKLRKAGSSHSKFGILKEILNKINPDEYLINFDLSKIFSFHKNVLYSNEEEIRLLFDARNIDAKNLVLTELIKPKYMENNNLINNKNIRYLELPLIPTNIETIPYFKISKIIIGYAYSLKEYQKLNNKLGNKCLTNLGYKPKITRSQLALQYWGEI
ncbi:DUF2971 domain-containing protein [Sphingobacterium rhinopitheci]|uniref:DUF2971 domain-containing protein n=1 Tax=Sphingobacterium rhinopitheci TaxID=2781960 RepID=UPI001F51D2ED|nr:DUF2971 domain-containing protein [Sphingobacterium rhinopitheci]MCI0922596.1 DUF2971 domain-containing protein [Sphingobacterium rhinopitheci]